MINVKDNLVVPETTGGGVLGKQITTQVDLKFDSAKDFDDFAAGRLPFNLILKNTTSGQTLTLTSRTLTENFKPSENKSMVTVWLVIDNLTAPVWDAQGCIQTLTNAENTPDGANIIISYAACNKSAFDPSPADRLGQLPPGASMPPGVLNKPGEPVKGVGVIIQRRPGGSASMRVTPSRSEVSENSEAALKLTKRAENVIIISSSKGQWSPKQ